MWQDEGHGEYAHYIAADCQQQRKGHIAAQLLQHKMNGSSTTSNTRGSWRDLSGIITALR
jgi:hypothetical protein